MPGMDRRGPNYNGPGSGRGMGLCHTRAEKKDFVSMGMLRRRQQCPNKGYGRGLGAQNRNFNSNDLFSDTTGQYSSVDHQLKWISNTIQALGKLLARIENRLSESTRNRDQIKE